MIIKPATGRPNDIIALESILSRQDLTGQQRRAVETELKKVRSGVKGEADASYQIDFHLRDTKNWMVLHDLRLDLGDDVAQIDHLVINRFLQIFACETKNFGEGLACNDRGEWVGFYRSRPFGIASPIKQNERHITVLKRFFKTPHDWHPRRLGMQIAVDMHSFVLVSNGARIGRPKKAEVEGMDTVVKIESFMKSVHEASDKLNGLLAMGGLVGAKTLQSFAEGLASAHSPITWDWDARFGLNHIASQGPVGSAPAAPAQQDTGEENSSAAGRCEACGVGVDEKVQWFCRRYKSRFGGKILCRECQST